MNRVMVEAAAVKGLLLFLYSHAIRLCSSSRVETRWFAVTCSVLTGTRAGHLVRTRRYEMRSWLVSWEGLLVCHRLDSQHVFRFLNAIGDQPKRFSRGERPRSSFAGLFLPSWTSRGNGTQWKHFIFSVFAHFSCVTEKVQRVKFVEI